VKADSTTERCFP